MVMRLRSVLMCSALLAAAVPATAQNAPAGLVDAYRAGVAAEKCDLGLPAAKSSQLGDAVQRQEQRSGLGQGDLDALWAKAQGEADADLAAFCANGTALIETVINAGI
jgi:hypothetical protein